MNDKFNKIFKNKRIIITGHTGFKGSWLTFWLHQIGANILGISKNIHGKPNHFKELYLKKKIKSVYLDIANQRELKKKILKFKPDYIFHLAGQSMVKRSYDDPKLTFLTNSLGTLSLLETLRSYKRRCNVILITSDKVYKNLEIKRGYKETDVLGGKDPYSGSKAAAETIIHSYFSSFFSKQKKIRIAIARAGNVIGGGDWNENRLIPDCVKAWSKKKKEIIRNANSTRPWQNVLDVVNGYLILATKLNKNVKFHGEIFNFGPSKEENFTVIQVVKYIEKYWDNIKWKIKKSSFFESKLLKLNSNKAQRLLKWKCKLSLKESLKITIEWYKKYYQKKNVYKISLETLKKYLDHKKP